MKRLDEEIDGIAKTKCYSKLEQISIGDNLEICLEIAKEKSDNTLDESGLVFSILMLIIVTLQSVNSIFYCVGIIKNEYSIVSAIILFSTAIILWCLYNYINKNNESYKNIYYYLLEIKRKRLECT